MATAFAATDEEGNKIWASPLVDATKGKYRTHMGRMGNSDGADNEKQLAGEAVCQ